VLVISGYGVRVNVDRGHLTIADGFPDEQRSFRLARATSKLKRLVLLGHSGTISLEAMRWVHDVGAALVQIDADGAVITLSAEMGSDEPRLRRAQALSPFNGIGLALAKELIRLKVERQWQVGERLPTGAASLPELGALLSDIDAADTVAALRKAEAAAAKAYWAAWSAFPVRFARIDLPRIPEHWGRAGTRGSEISGSPRKATNPANAVLNYLYGILEAEARIALLTVGLDPGLGVMHADQAARDSLALDVMEAGRPEVDTIALELLARRTFAKREFFEMADGTCRLVAPLPQQLAGSVTRIRRAVGPLAELAVRRLSASPQVRFASTAGSRGRMRQQPSRASASPVPTPLTQANRRAGRQTTRKAPARQAVVGVTESACMSCGQFISGGRDYCAECLPEYRQAAAQRFGALALERVRQGRSVGADPTKSAAALVSVGRTQSANRAAEVEWDRTHADKPDPATFATNVLPLLASVSAHALSRATGLSVGYCSQIKKRQVVPHPRHWAALQKLPIPSEQAVRRETRAAHAT
jgi:CRISPR-associated endonuclease Cas1